ncbi:MAG TPA: cyclase family protein [Parvularculaceae bacterium]|nr:cyclase family protein [Amphiplicatus sp.]MCB9956371.1 cyclase family protein [Caulobacterales bacterium]HOP19376.1 cyclase family protein [Amphiplicatus sp.]HPE32496.1 cyclase family protein [Parvularculaceae bacterium]HRX38276.1 cyclase family protein [Parvularculaceae bacterium]
MSLLETLSGAVMSGAVRTIDLTHTLDPDFPVLVLPPEFGQCQPFRIEEVSRYDERGPAWYWRNFSCNEHTGTHFDAPIHWVTGKDLPHSSVDTIDPAAFIRPACVLDFSKEVAKNADFVLTADHIKAWEKTHGAIPAGSWVLFRTDWSKRSGEEYLNLKEDGAHSPGPDAGAIRYLINERDVIGFGVETIGTDAGQGGHFDPPYPAHTLLHGAGRYGLQCLKNLDQLPPKGAVIISPPLKIKHGSGSPLRVLALVEGK